MSDQGEKSVVGALVAGAAAELAAAEAEQLPMFEVPESRGRDVQATLERRQGPGRPPGAENKSTAELRKWLLSKGVHPLSQLMRWSLHTPETLAKELDCTRLEAFDRLTKMWGELAPYFAARIQPTDDKGNAVPFFNLSIGGLAGGVADGLPPWSYLEAIKTAEISHFAATEIPQSHEEQSHEMAKTLKEQEE